jgi:hypothetical protein
MKHNRYTDVSVLTAQGTMCFSTCALYELLKFRINKGTNYAVVFKIDEKYEGETRDGVYHGMGRQIYYDGTWYAGYFKNGKREGQGIFSYDNGTYEGEWCNNLRHGIGKYAWNDLRVYVGEWIYGDRSGHGVWTMPNEDRFEGTFKNDDREGVGTVYYHDGRIYTSNFSKDEREGVGKHSWPTGEVLELVLSNGCIIGTQKARVRDELFEVDITVPVPQWKTTRVDFSNNDLQRKVLRYIKLYASQQTCNC